MVLLRVLATIAFLAGPVALADDDASQWPLDFESTNSLYTLRLAPIEDVVKIGATQAYVLRVTLEDGTPVYPALISVGGGMEAHGHGLPTNPQVTAYGGNGEYLLEGVRFSMEGAWRLSFSIESAHGADRADVDFDVSF